MKNTVFPLALAATLLASSPSFSIDYNTGLQAYKSGKYAVALQHWGALAAKGEPRAQYAIGLIYDRGKGVKQNKETAVNWYRKAAEGGLPQAQYSMGMHYAKGEGVPQDLREALTWFQIAETNGHDKAVQDSSAAEPHRPTCSAHRRLGHVFGVFKFVTGSLGCFLNSEYRPGCNLPAPR